MSEILSVLKQDIRPSERISSLTGRTGEDLAAKFLVENDYRIVLSNFKVPIGRNTRGVQVTGEIDIIALDSGVLTFIEVKTRRSDIFAGPLSAVDLRKQRQITRTSRIYKKVFGLYDMPFRFDVVTVLMKHGEPPRIELVKGFWTESKFRKRSWSGDIF